MDYHHQTSMGQKKDKQYGRTIWGLANLKTKQTKIEEFQDEVLDDLISPRRTNRTTQKDRGDKEGVEHTPPHVPPKTKGTCTNFFIAKPYARTEFLNLKGPRQPSLFNNPSSWLEYKYQYTHKPDAQNPRR